MIHFQPNHPELALRPESPSDREFLCGLYSSTRLDELAQTGWPPSEINAFLRNQFEAQSSHYAQHYRNASFRILQHSGEDIGRLYLDELEDEFRIVDIAILPAHRGHGFGTAILRDLLEFAGSAGKAVRIHVEQNNPAQSLYQRLGFRKTSEHGIYHLMECLPLTANH